MGGFFDSSETEGKVDLVEGQAIINHFIFTKDNTEERDNISTRWHQFNAQDSEYVRDDEHF